MLSRLRSMQMEAEQQELLEARGRAETRSQAIDGAKLAVDEALAFWMSGASNGALVDAALLNLASAALMLAEVQLVEAHRLHEQALEAVEDQRQRVSESMTRRSQAEEIERKLGRRLQRRLEERRQTVIEDRVAFEWSSNG